MVKQIEAEPVRELWLHEGLDSVINVTSNWRTRGPLWPGICLESHLTDRGPLGLTQGDCPEQTKDRITTKSERLCGWVDASMRGSGAEEGV